ncbi:AraC family transcriptional regulator ligand-binding domain-containing protein [Zhongshania sp. BJYM1]|uniref:AraC family transcriptional regulator ligand-binding domain-containing protein n=1 Tax=Zhongshania aquatica TaxID=2965069 RepID=UPI0022B5957E|nr:AraC family transcriptional regulator ligand-binding domain-containing protein [Marortus sp. BJYM1]
MKHTLTEDEDVLHALFEACKSLGIDLKDAASKAGLPAKLLTLPNHFVPSHLLNYLLETIAKDYHCQDFALHIASKLQSPELGLPTTVMSLSSDFKTGLEHASHYSAYYQDTGYWRHDICDEQVTLVKSANSLSSKYYRQRNLLGTAQMFLLLNTLSSHLWQPKKVCFSFSDPGAKFSQTYRDFFDCELIFDQPNDSISFPVDYLEFSISSSDPMLLRSMEVHIRGLQEELLHGRDIVERCRLLIDERLRFAHCSEDELAFYLKISTAELQRELKQANTSFKHLIEQQISARAAFYATRCHAPMDIVLSCLMPDDEERLYALLKEREKDPTEPTLRQDDIIKGGISKPFIG